MTCTRFEPDLALYVEHDLPEAEAVAVEAHLRECATCPSFLAELRASQAQVKDLASSEIDPEALAAVHVRTIVAAARARRAHHPVPAWAAAAALIVALGGVLWWAASIRHVDPVRQAAAPRPRAPRVIPSPSTAPASRSTLPGPPAVSPHMERAHAHRGRMDREPPVPTLSPEDADQLARAVVAIARIQRVDEIPVDSEPSPAPPPLMRLATADPDVVIYWQLDPTGGE